MKQSKIEVGDVIIECDPGLENILVLLNENGIKTKSSLIDEYNHIAYITLESYNVFMKLMVIYKEFHFNNPSKDCLATFFNNVATINLEINSINDIDLIIKIDNCDETLPSFEKILINVFGVK